MLHRLKRHPWAVNAHFDWSLALVFAIPAATARGLLGPGLEPDLYGESGFVAAAFVQTRRLLPVGMPRFLAQDFFLAGMRVFARARLPDGRTVRGLRILGSATDSWRMKIADDLISHYHYQKVTALVTRTSESLGITVRDRAGKVTARLDVDLRKAEKPPPGSPFPDLRTARRFAGPMPYTFTHEPETQSLILVEGVREHWEPRPVTVDPGCLDFFTGPPFAAAGQLPQLANAFFVEHVDYHWKRGVLVPIQPSSTV